MEFTALKKRPNFEADKKLTKRYLDFKKLLEALQKKEIPDSVVTSINQEIEQINSSGRTNKDLCKQLRKAQYRILKMVEKELKLVPKNHYRNLWMAIGMAAFGIPFGVAFGTSLGNMAYLGIGIPIGMAIGVGIGVSMDSNAAKNGKQLDIEAIF